MMRRRIVLAVVAVLVLALVVVEFGLWLGLVAPGEYDRGEVVVVDETGTHQGTVEVRIADSPEKRTIGLGRTDTLAQDEGMLFVHDDTGRHGYVMRGMDFPLDIVFVAANGTITEIHHADPASPLTPESLLERYAGEGTYVMEVNRGWTNETGVDVGDQVVVPDGVDRANGNRPTTTSTETATDTPEASGELPTVTAVDRNGTGLGAVRVRIADNRSERYTGLSETASMPRDEGMLFVYESEGQRAFVMRNMSFALDIHFVGADGTITEIHHASVPPPGTEERDLHRYRGRGQYVLEVNRGWTNETGVDVGDTIRVPDGY